MRAIIIKQFGGLDGLAIENLPDPVPQPGSVLIEVKAFRINHAEPICEKANGPKPQKSAVSSALALLNPAQAGSLRRGLKWPR